MRGNAFAFMSLLFNLAFFLFFFSFVRSWEWIGWFDVAVFWDIKPYIAFLLPCLLSLDWDIRERGLATVVVGYGGWGWEPKALP